MAIARRPAEPGDATPTRAGSVLRVNDLDMYVEIVGAGPDVFMLHGFPDSHALWRNQIPALVEAGFRVIVPDLRGYGRTEAPSGVASYRIETLVADVLALADALGVQKVRLVGHDWGAVIGWMFAIAHPERVERYVAISVGHPTAYARGGLRQKLMGWYILMFQLPGVAERLLSLNNFALLGVFSKFPQELPNWRVELGRPGRLTAALNYYRANLAMIRPFERGDVKSPVMGVWSSRDVALVERQMTELGPLLQGWLPLRADRGRRPLDSARGAGKAQPAPARLPAAIGLCGEPTLTVSESSCERVRSTTHRHSPTFALAPPAARAGTQRFGARGEGLTGHALAIFA